MGAFTAPREIKGKIIFLRGCYALVYFRRCVRVRVYLLLAQEPRVMNVSELLAVS